VNRSYYVDRDSCHQQLTLIVILSFLFDLADLEPSDLYSMSPSWILSIIPIPHQIRRCQPCLPLRFQIISNRPQLGQFSIERMHEAFVLFLLEDRLLGVKRKDLLRGDGCEVEMSDV